MDFIFRFFSNITPPQLFILLIKIALIFFRHTLNLAFDYIDMQKSMELAFKFIECYFPLRNFFFSSRKNFRLPVFNLLTHFKMLRTRFDKFLENISLPLWSNKNYLEMWRRKLYIILCRMA